MPKLRKSRIIFDRDEYDIVYLMPNQKGISSFFILIVVAAVAVVASLLLNRGISQSRVNPLQQIGHQDESSQARTDWPLLWGPPNTSCQDKKDVKFSVSPIDVKDILVIEPMGELREGHIIPGDHIGIEYKTSPSSTPVKVFAPANGTIVTVERHPYTPPPGYPQNVRHYHFYIVHSCTQFSGFVHLTEFAPEILAASPELKNLNDQNVSKFTNIHVNIPVKAGQQIGTAWTFGLLGAVTVDLNHTNKGYLNIESYKAENWRPHAVSLFDYLEEPLRSQVFAKSPRTAEPKGGKIDFDIEGKVVGSWFEEGSRGFRDGTKDPGLCGNFPCPYWDGHLALVYDFIDPMQLRVSVGHDFGLSSRTPFGVKGNQPDFKNIGKSDGLIKYELVTLKDVTKEGGYESNSTLITENDESKILGTMLVQMLEERKIKMEIFPGKTKNQVNGFTDNAKNFVR